eukprot:3448229-Amphidinium_carterae.1
MMWLKSPSVTGSCSKKLWLFKPLTATKGTGHKGQTPRSRKPISEAGKGGAIASCLPMLRTCTIPPRQMRQSSTEEKQRTKPTYGTQASVM